jgi:penicillin amidase
MLLLAAALVLTLAAPAAARVINAESILPPGQSGFVGPDGKPSPHVTDQTQPFIDFRYKSAVLGQRGTTERPRAGVRIVRDDYGVPAVTGTTDQGAWWGVGYAVAQDRLAELELFRRNTSGHLAEILGAGSLADDITARRDYYTPTEYDALFRALPAKFRARFASYAQGVNAWIAHVRRTPKDLPLEFSALKIPLRNWSVRDSVTIGVFLARTIPSGDGAELSNLRALRALGASSFDKLIPLRVAGSVSSVPRASGLFPSVPGRTAAQERAAFTRSASFVGSLPLPAAAAGAAQSAGRLLTPQLGARGSYAFAVRDRRRGRAVLFNGPQLGFSIPELFVELEVHAPGGLDVRGTTAPGIPVIGLGHNKDVAWGVTSGLSDDDDLYAERLTAAGSDRYRFKGKVRAMTCRAERFVVKGAAASTQRLCRTVHGPVQERAGSIAYARRYAIWKQEIRTLVGLSDLNAAKSITDVERAVSKVTWNENLVAADSRGNIGYWHPGLIQLRPSGYDERLPYPGTGEAEWRGFLKTSQLPHVVNPAQGWVANWNNVPSQGWTNGDAEASERLGGPLHRASFLFDLVSGLARQPTYAGAKTLITKAGTTAQQRPLLTPRLQAAATGATGNAKALLDTVLAWDGSYARTDAAGTIDPGVAAWQELKAQVRKLGLAPLGAQADGFGGSAGRSHAYDASNGDSHALRTLGSPGYQQAADAAFTALAARFGSSDPATWRDPRKPYSVSAQGLASAPKLPFFDRGTWEQFVELGR